MVFVHGCSEGSVTWPVGRTGFRNTRILAYILCIPVFQLVFHFLLWILYSVHGFLRILRARGGSMKTAEKARSPTPGQLSCVIAISDFYLGVF